MSATQMEVNMKNYSKELETTTLLHLHTDHGSIDSVGKISDYMNKFKEYGVDYAMCSDHGATEGLYSFYKSAKKAGITPGLGCEFYLYNDRDKEGKGSIKDKDTDDIDPDDMKNNHLIGVAKNESGLTNVIKINNEAIINGFYRKPRTTEQVIFEMGDDIMFTTACLAGFPARLIARDKFDECKRRLSMWKERFGEDFYIELQINEVEEQHKANHHLIKFGKELGIKTVIAQDCHYVDKGDDFVQLLKMMGKASKSLRDFENGKPKDVWVFTSNDLYVKTNKDILETAKRFGYEIEQKDLIQSLINNHEFKYKTNIHWDLSVKRYNKYTPPEGYESSVEYFDFLLKQKLKEYIEKGYIPRDQLNVYAERMAMESEILINKGYIDYLLETREAIEIVINKLGGDRTNLGVGRGSACASLCVFLLGITKIDPIKHDLLFFRFLSDARSSEILDIDI